MKTARMIPAALFGLSMLSAPSLRGQQGDPRWLPWIGCWEAAEETSGELLCVQPSGAGVEVREVADGTVRSTQTLAADGRAYPVTMEGCQGTRTAEFSTDGRRIFTIDEQACDGDVSRTSTGLIAMVAPDEWIDVQAAQEDGRGLGWARRYRPASAQAVADAGFADLADRGVAARRARMAAAARADIDDVIEALRRVDPEGVRTWIAELDDPFELDSRQLLRLADAGVPSSVIDVMVAVSYPDRFALDRDGDIERLVDRTPQREADPRYGRGYGRPRRGFFGPLYPDPYYGGGYYGSPYGGYYGPGVVVVSPRRDPEPNAKVVKGRGYTRGSSSGSGGGNSSGGSVKAPTSSGSPSSEPASKPDDTPSETRHAKPRGG